MEPSVNMHSEGICPSHGTERAGAEQWDADLLRDSIAVCMLHCSYLCVLPLSASALPLGGPQSVIGVDTASVPKSPQSQVKQSFVSRGFHIGHSSSF